MSQTFPTVELDNKQLDVINFISFVLEILVVCLYILGMIPALFWVLVWFAAPMLIINIIFAALKNQKLLTYSALNLGLCFASLFPILGWITLAGGIAVSISNASELYKMLYLPLKKKGRTVTKKALKVDEE